MGLHPHDLENLPEHMKFHFLVCEAWAPTCPLGRTQFIEALLIALLYT